MLAPEPSTSEESSSVSSIDHDAASLRHMLVDSRGKAQNAKRLDRSPFFKRAVKSLSYNGTRVSIRG